MSDGPAAGVLAEGRPVVHDIPVGLKSTLVDSDGVAYREFRKGLRPRWVRIWAELLAGYAVAATVVVALAVWRPTGLAAVGAALGGALAIGYAIAYVNNFFHESAHHNLLPNRRANDVATNVLMGWLFGSSIDLYRKIHFQHHRALGTTMDSENSYFDPLRVRYMIEGLVGLKVLRTLRRYREVEREKKARRKAQADFSRNERLLWTAIAGAVNLAILVLLGPVAGAWAAAAAWAVGVLAFFPFFVSLRQTLEHRAEDAEADVDYSQVDHGAVNRLFGDGPLASTLGSAGFNRHALHHWEPQVSYTNLRDLEAYLSRTELEPLLAERRTTYHHTLLRLLEL